MWFQGLSLQLAALSVLLPVSDAFSVTTTNDANSLANAILGQGITLLQASFSGAAISSGSFSEGPFGIGSGAILTSGSAIGALPNGDHYVNNGAPGSDTYYSPNTFNATLLTVDFFLDPTYSGIRVEFIFASEEEGGSADPMGIFIGDTDGQRITATNRYVLRPLAITPPDSVTSYPGSSPPLWVDILTSGAQTMDIAICDQGDSEWDSALLIKAEGCVDCDTDMRLAYVTTTTTLDAGEVPYTSTITASGTVSGTIEIGVLAATTEEATTTAVNEITTTTAEEAISTISEKPTTTTDVEITTTTEEITTTAGVEITTTAEETTTTAADETTTTTEETTTTAVDGITTSTTTEEVPTTTVEEPITTTATDETTTTADSETITTTHEPSTGDTVTLSEPLPNTTTTSLATSDATTETSTIGTESDVITTTAQELSTEITTGTETTNISDAPVDGTTTSSNDGETTLASSTISASSNAETESSSSDISTNDTAVSNPSTKTTTESIETTTDRQIESSTNTITTVEAMTSNFVQPTSKATIPLSVSTTTESFIDSAITIGSSSPSPNNFPFNAGNSTRTEDVVVPIVTTITYMVVDPNDPSHITTTEFCSTLRPSPCLDCQYQRPTTVKMTTTTVDCNACGHSGENTIVLEVPAGAAGAAQTRDHAAYETHLVQHHESNPYRQRPRPSKEGSHTWEKPQPQNPVPVAGDEPYNGDEGHKLEHPQSDHVGPTDAEGGRHQAPKPVETMKTEPRPESEPADVIKTEAKPTTVGGNDKPEPLELTFRRRPVPAPTSMTPDSPVVVVSAAVKTMDGMLLSMFCFTGLLLLL
ncbi:hypothetical protein FCULG_00001932 [Fusarium culmorum]|uniref:Uncharacterized protein n=1 Tax=Fusarium culmorum TaxID=5516 RepID=A0A2T4GPQ1_FUSCU|nr:hypothetical protein FCULG_00001932 [Fusarium culmorum]